MLPLHHGPSRCAGTIAASACRWHGSPAGAGHAPPKPGASIIINLDRKTEPLRSPRDQFDSRAEDKAPAQSRRSGSAVQGSAHVKGGRNWPRHISPRREQPSAATDCPMRRHESVQTSIKPVMSPSAPSWGRAGIVGDLATRSSRTRRRQVGATRRSASGASCERQQALIPKLVSKHHDHPQEPLAIHMCGSRTQYLLPFNRIDEQRSFSQTCVPTSG